MASGAPPLSSCEYMAGHQPPPQRKHVAKPSEVSHAIRADWACTKMSDARYQPWKFVIASPAKKTRRESRITAGNGLPSSSTFGGDSPSPAF
jgi:hypothetical protein